MASAAPPAPARGSNASSSVHVGGKLLQVQHFTFTTAAGARVDRNRYFVDGRKTNRAALMRMLIAAGKDWKDFL